MTLFIRIRNSSKKYSPSGSVVGGILPTKLPTEVAQLLLILRSLLQISLVRRWQRPSKRTQAALLRALPPLLGLQANTAESYYPWCTLLLAAVKLYDCRRCLDKTYVISNQLNRHTSFRVMQNNRMKTILFSELWQIDIENIFWYILSIKWEQHNRSIVLLSIES